MRAAGLATRPQLDEWYKDGKIDGEDYLTLSLAAGRTEQEAMDALKAAHKKHSPHGSIDPFKDLIEPSLPQYSGPKRTARRPVKRGPELRGHPLD